MWITDYREQYRLELSQLGALIRRAGRRKEPQLRVSDVLLERLETEPSFRTVPALADLIAEACGATAKQRDALVLEKYRGTWKPTRVKPEIEHRAAAAPIQAPAQRGAKGLTHGGRSKFANAREVVKLNRAGVELGRYRSCNYAAIQNGITESRVTERCHRGYKSDEFKYMGFTFRFAEEWDKMSEAERREDLDRLKGVKGSAGGCNVRGVMLINRSGAVVYHKSIVEAARVTGLSHAALHHRLMVAQAKIDGGVAEANGYKALLAEVWDALAPEAQARIREQDDR